MASYVWSPIPEAKPERLDIFNFFCQEVNVEKLNEKSSMGDDANFSGNFGKGKANPLGCRSTILMIQPFGYRGGSMDKNDHIL